MMLTNQNYPSMTAARERAGELGYAMEPVSVQLHEAYSWQLEPFHLIYLLLLLPAAAIYEISPPLLYVPLGLVLSIFIWVWVTRWLENYRFGDTLLGVRICEGGDWEYRLELGGRTWLADATVAIKVTRAYEEMDFGERVGRMETLFSREGHLLDHLIHQPDEHTIVARLPGPNTDLPPSGYYREGKVTWEISYTHPQRWWTDLERRAKVHIALAEPPPAPATGRKSFRIPSWVPIFGSR